MQGSKISDADLYLIGDQKAVEERQRYQLFSHIVADDLAAYNAFNTLTRDIPALIANGLYYTGLGIGYGLYYTGLGIGYGLNYGLNYLEERRNRNAVQINEPNPMPVEAQEMPELPSNPVWVPRYFATADLDQYDSDTDSDYENDCAIPQTNRRLRSGDS